VPEHEALVGTVEEHGLMLKSRLGLEDLTAQPIIELPDRVLACVTILIYAPVSVDVDLSHAAQNAFQNAEVNLLRIDQNNVMMKVERNVSDLDIRFFCNQIAALLSAQCLKILR
jgi:hypothetical protein